LDTQDGSRNAWNASAKNIFVWPIWATLKWRHRTRDYRCRDGCALLRYRLMGDVKLEFGGFYGFYIRHWRILVELGN